MYKYTRHTAILDHFCSESDRIDPIDINSENEKSPNQKRTCSRNPIRMARGTESVIFMVLSSVCLETVKT